MRNRFSFLVAVATCIVSSQVLGIHAYWIGGTSGSWSENANWSGNAVPNTANYFVHITNEVPVTISAANATVGRIAFSGAKFTGVNANPLQNNTVVDLEAGAVYDATTISLTGV